jgi:hypothetical protein
MSENKEATAAIALVTRDLYGVQLRTTTQISTMATLFAS